MKRKITLLGLFLLSISMLHAQHSLFHYISEARQNSPLIKDNQNQNRANQLEIERLKAQFTKPQIGLAGNYLFAPIVSTDHSFKLEPNSKGAEKYYGYDLGLTNGGQYQGLVTITQPLFSQQRLSKYEEQVLVTSQINQNNIKLTEHEIEKLVTDQYILCLLDIKQVTYAQTIINLIQDQRIIVQKLVNSALLKPSDLALLNIELKDYESKVLLNRTYYRRDLMDLNLLCGINDTTLVTLDTLELHVLNQMPSVMSAYLEKYRLDSLNLMAAQKVFETKYKPQVNVFANTGLNAVNISTLPRRFGVGAGVSVIWNFYDGRQKEISQRKTKILLQSVEAYRGNFLAQNDVRKSRYLVELNSYKEQADLLQQQANEYMEVINSYKKEIINGQVSVINFINVLKNMTSVQRDLSLLQTNQLLLINAYNYWNW